MANETPQIDPKNNLFAAFLEAQKELPALTLDGKNPHFNSEFSTLKEVTSKFLPVLNRHGIGVTQAPQMDNGEPVLETTLVHAATGQVMVSRYPLRPTKQDPQGFIAALTYARRVCLAAICCGVSDVDDDGNAASAGGNGKPKQLIDKKQVEMLKGLIELTQSDIEKFCNYFKIEAIPDLPKNQYDNALKMLNQKGKAANASG